MKEFNAEQKRTIRNLIVFTVVVLASGWLGHTLDLWRNSPPDEPLGMLLWITTPLITVLLLRAVAGDGWQDFGLWPRFKDNLTWYLVSLLFYPLVATMILTLGKLLGVISFPHFSFELLLPAFMGALIPSFIKNIFEEFAWRGYLAPKINLLGLNDYLGHALVGLVWACWHIPYYFFYLSPTVIQAATTQSMVTFIPLMIIGLIAASVVYGEIRLLTHSVWPPLLLHTIDNVFVDVMVIEHAFQITPGMDFLVSPLPTSLLMIVFSLIFGVGLRQLRLKQQVLVVNDNYSS